MLELDFAFPDMKTEEGAVIMKEFKNGLIVLVNNLKIKAGAL